MGWREVQLGPPSFSASAYSYSAEGAWVLPVLEQRAMHRALGVTTWHGREPLCLAAQLALEVQITRKSFLVLYQSPSPIITPLPSPALSSHRHLSVHPPSPPLPVSSQAPRGPLPLGLQFVVPLARYPHSLFLSPSSSVSELLAPPSPKVRENKGEEIQASPFLLLVNTSVGRGLQQRVKCKC